MSRARRNRLGRLGGAVRPRACTLSRVGRSYDNGFAIASQVPAHAGPIAFAAAAAPAAERDWSWPAAEPSALTWAEPEEGDDRMDRFLSPAASIAAPAPAYLPTPPLAEDEADAEVRAILAEKGLQPLEPVPPAAPEPAPADGAVSREPPPPVDRHAVFAAMGRPMAHANSFSLGRFDLDRHFSMLEEGLSLAVPAAGGAGEMRPDPRQLDELDLVGELALISQAAGVAPAPAGEDGPAFLRRVATAQGARLVELDAGDGEYQSDDYEPFAGDEDEAEADDQDEPATMPAFAGGDDVEEQDDG